MILHKFGDNKYDNKIFLIFDGTHYNTGIYTNKDKISKIFKNSDQKINLKMMELGKMIKNNGDY